MSEEHVRKAIEERLATIWGSTTPIAWDDDSQFTPKKGEDFIRPSFECIGSSNIAIKCERNNYLLTIEVNTVKGKGSGTNLRHSDTIKDGFVYQTFDGVVFKNGEVKRTGQIREWYQRRVLINLYYNNTRS